jgi:hypothetical protein
VDGSQATSTKRYDTAGNVGEPTPTSVHDSNMGTDGDSYDTMVERIDPLGSIHEPVR